MPKAKNQPPKTAKFQKRPRRKTNKELRTREYLTGHEVDQLGKAARHSGRYGQRDAAMILLMFRHGLRVSELVHLRWEQVDFKQGLLHVNRIKNGLASTHPLRGIELRALRQLKRNSIESPYLFVSERNAPLTARTIRHIIARAGEHGGFTFTVHPHMLRHSTGFYLANQGHDTRAIQSYLGHANIKNTTIYTELSSKRFHCFWQD